MHCKKGITDETIWLAFGVIVLILTGVVFYNIFPRSGCDELAKLSVEEVRRAIQQASDHPGITYNANVKLCQEPQFSVIGLGTVQNWIGLNVPEYMIYYQEFPAEPIVSGVFGKFSESYPFERAYVGHRPYDLRPTLTQFKQFYRTRFLEKPCTDATGLCFNVRGQEDIYLINSTEPLEDVRLKRPGTGLPLVSAENPKFYLVAPCYATVRFTKQGNNKIIADVMFQSVGGWASNYCYATRDKIDTLTTAYGTEVACEAAMIALDIISLGTKKAAIEGAKQAGKKILKEGGENIAKKLVETELKTILKGKVIKEITKDIRTDAIQSVARSVIKMKAVREFNQDVAGSTIRISISKAISNNKIPISREVEEEISQRITKKATTEYADKPLAEAMELATQDALSEAAQKGGLKIETGAIKKMAKESADETVEVYTRMLAKEAAEQGLPNSAKARVLAEAASRRYYNMEGMPPKGQQQLAFLFGVAPCTDFDICRSMNACTEAAMWPGGFFPVGLTADKFSTEGKFAETAAQIFYECTDPIVYQGVTDLSKVICTEPPDLVQFMKAELKLKPDESLTIKKLGEYMGFSSDAALINGVMWGISDNVFTCLSTEEVSGTETHGTCAKFSTHTYKFPDKRKVKEIIITARLFESNCNADIIVESSDDKMAWTTLKTVPAQKDEDGFPLDNKIDITGELKLNYLRISESTKDNQEETRCGLDSSVVVLDPKTDEYTIAEANKEYSIEAGNFHYFQMPQNFISTAKELCESTNYCLTVSKYVIDETPGYKLKYNIVEGGENFHIAGGDRIGILPEKDSNVIFKVVS